MDLLPYRLGFIYKITKASSQDKPSPDLPTSNSRISMTKEHLPTYTRQGIKTNLQGSSFFFGIITMEVRTVVVVDGGRSFAKADLKEH